MVQLPATAAIEYVAAGHFIPGGLLAGGTFGRGGLLAGFIFVREGFRPGDFCPGGLLPGGTFVRGAYALSPKFNAYTNRLGFLCLAS